MMMLIKFTLGSLAHARLTEMLARQLMDMKKVWDHDTLIWNSMGKFLIIRGSAPYSGQIHSLPRFL